MDQLNVDQRLDFGAALRAAKAGKQIARKGWNGKNMFVFLNKGNYDFPNGKSNGESNDYIEGVNIELFETGDVGTVTRLPNLNMRSASGATVTGWLASQTDLLAEDWNIIN
jgi:hypothetical protein